MRKMTNFVLAVVGQKGGVGKTTLAYNFFVRVLKGDPTAILIDCDNNQYSSFELSLDRKDFGVKPDLLIKNMSSEELEKQILEISKKHKTIIIESGGRIDKEMTIAMRLADKIVMPIKSSVIDIKTISNVEANLALSKNTQIKCVLVPNMIKSEASLNFLINQAKPEFFKFSKAFLKDRSAYVTSFDQGKAIFELKPKNKIADQEFEQLFQEIFND
jgi:chromosome partitioning protein